MRLRYREGMKRLAVIALVVVGLVVLAPASPNASIFALPRATADRPDDLGGLQVHVVYAVPSDGADRAFDTSGDLENTTAANQRWLAAQTGGRALRLDTHLGSLDVTFHRLPRSDADYRALGRGARDLIEADLRAAGLVTSKKIYPVYYDGTNGVTCGGGSWPPSLQGTVGVYYLRSQIPGLAPCFDYFAPPGGPSRYPEFSMLHEMMHVLGIVGTCAPHHHDAGHVNESPTDLMWSGVGSWSPSVLDVGRDDYYGAGIPGCADLATAGFLSADADFPLTVAKEGNGAGRVSSATWNAIDCGAACSAPYSRGTVVRLTAEPDAGLRFVGWGGDCSGTGPCVVTMTGPKTVSARFEIPPKTMSVELAGAGRGTVTSVPGTISCLPNCGADFAHGTVVRLTAVARAGSRFAGWSGDCTGTRACTLTMDEDKFAEARFSLLVCRVPRVIGRRLSVARSLIRRAGCAVGRVRSARSRRPRGRVVSQRPRAGSVRARGARITLTVSRGRR
jgi:hypothetical protein